MLYGTETRPPVLESTNPMNIVVCAASALSVAMLFYSWRSYALRNECRNQRLRERVTYMLWTMANSIPDCK